MSAIPFSPAIACLLATHTLRAAVRQRALNLLVLLAAGVVAGASALRDFNFGASELKFVADLGFGAMTFFGSVLTIAATTQAFFSELEQRTILTLLAKPVRRSEFIVGKYLGVAALAGVFCAALTLLLAIMLRTRAAALADGTGDAVYQVNLVAVAVVGLMLWLKLALLAALTLLVASFAQTQLYAMTLGFLVLVICHLQYLAQDAAARGGTFAGRSGAWLLARMLPNFQIFNFADSLGAGIPLAWGEVARLTVYASGYAAAVCALAAYSFQHREL